QAALALACVPVPMHALDNPASIAYILSDSDASLLVAASDTQWQAIANTGVALTVLRQVVVLHREIVEPAPIGTVPVRSLEEWLSHIPPGISGKRVRPPAAGDL